MKYTKSDLKSLIKECLVEILSEGLGPTLVESATKIPQPSPRMVPSQPRPRVPTASLHEAIKQESKGNPLLANILADTAASTLQNQIAAEGRGPMDATSMAIVDVEPKALFGEDAAMKWAALAFDTPAPKLPTS